MLRRAWVVDLGRPATERRRSEERPVGVARPRLPALEPRPGPRRRRGPSSPSRPVRPRRQGRDRRGRAVAAGQPARRQQRRLGVHQPARRLGRPAHRGLRPQGLPGRHGLGLGAPRQLLPGRARRPGPRRRRRRPRPRGPAPGGGGHRHHASSPSSAVSPSPAWPAPAPAPPTPGRATDHAAIADHGPDVGRGPRYGTDAPDGSPGAGPARAGQRSPGRDHVSRREDRTQRRVTVVRHTRPPAAGRFARRPGPRPDGWRAKLPGRAAAAPGLAGAGGRAGPWPAPARPPPAPAARCGTGCGEACPRQWPGRLLAAVVAIALFTGATWTTTRSALLDVDHIEVVRRALVTPDQAATGAGLRRGQPMVSVDAAGAERRLRAPAVGRHRGGRAGLPQHASGSTSPNGWPSAIAARPTGGWVLLDGGGRVLAERPDRPRRPSRGHRRRRRTPVAGRHRWPRPVRRSTSWPRCPTRSAAGRPCDPRRRSRHASHGSEGDPHRPADAVAAKVAALSVLLERVGEPFRGLSRRARSAGSGGRSDSLPPLRPASLHPGGAPRLPSIPESRARLKPDKGSRQLHRSAQLV